MLCAGLSEERSLQNCAAPQWSHGKSGSKEHNHFKGPLEENNQSKRMKERLLTQDKGGAAPRKMPAELGMLLGELLSELSWKSPEGRRWLGELQWQTEERGLPGSSLHFQRAKGPREGDLVQSVKVHPSEVYLTTRAH